MVVGWVWVGRMSNLVHQGVGTILYKVLLIPNGPNKDQMAFGKILGRDAIKPNLAQIGFIRIGCRMGIGV